MWGAGHQRVRARVVCACGYDGTRSRNHVTTRMFCGEEMGTHRGRGGVTGVSVIVEVEAFLVYWLPLKFSSRVPG